MTGIVAHTYPEWWLKLTGQAAHWSTDYSNSAFDMQQNKAQDAKKDAAKNKAQNRAENCGSNCGSNCGKGKQGTESGVC